MVLEGTWNVICCNPTLILDSSSVMSGNIPLRCVNSHVHWQTGNYLPWKSRVYSVQFSSAQSCPILCDPMNRSLPGLPVHHQLPEFTQTQASSIWKTYVWLESSVYGYGQYRFGESMHSNNLRISSFSNHSPGPSSHTLGVCPALFDLSSPLCIFLLPPSFTSPNPHLMIE